MATRDALKRKKPISDEHFVPEGEEQAERLRLAEQALALARFTANDEEAAEAEAKLETVRQEVRETGASFVITAVGRARFEELLREHAPTEEQAAKGATYNPDTFPPALFAESVDGDLTPEEWVEDFFQAENWGAGEVQALKDKVIKVNTATRVAELGN